MTKSRAYFIAGAAVGIIVAIVALRYFGMGSTPVRTAGEDRHHEERHDEKGTEAHERVVRLHEEDLTEFGIEVKEAGGGRLKLQVELPGEITPNGDRLAHIVPRATGVVRKVFKSTGDTVKSGELLAVLDSRELADAKATYLAALRRTDISRTNLIREEELWKKRISPELDYLEAKKLYDEADIELRSSEQKLHAFGLSDEYVKQLPLQPDVTYTRYELRAPFGGTIIQKHITVGEIMREDSEAFVIADMNTVWVNISVYQKDMSSVHEGQEVTISAGGTVPDVIGTISYVSPVAGEETRTAIARVVLPNTKGLLRPGLFVTAKLAVGEVSVPMLVPKTALVSENGSKEIFVRTGEGFIPRTVTVGRTDASHLEVTAGLKPGEQYVARGGFTLKAQMSKGAFGDGHHH